jgi:hypothetical protein
MGGWDQNGPQTDWLGGVEWIQLAQDRDHWWALVNAVMNLRVLVPQSSWFNGSLVGNQLSDKSGLKIIHIINILVEQT